MKGLSTLVAFVLVIVISISALIIALNIGNPAIEKSKEILILNEGKGNLKVLDNTINQVLQEGDGSSRRITLSVTGGTYNIENRTIEFIMDTKQQIVAPGVNGLEDGVFIEASEGKIRAYILYNFDFVGSARFERGLNNMLITNQVGKIKIN